MTASASGPARTTGPTRPRPTASTLSISRTAIDSPLRERSTGWVRRLAAAADQDTPVGDPDRAAGQTCHPGVDPGPGPGIEDPFVGRAGQHVPVQRSVGERRTLMRARVVVGPVFPVEPDQEDIGAVDFVARHLAIPQLVLDRDDDEPGGRRAVSHGTARPATATEPGRACRAGWWAGRAGRPGRRRNPSAGPAGGAGGRPSARRPSRR